jgi:hypothetical protein
VNILLFFLAIIMGSAVLVLLLDWSNEDPDE